ncbi:MAG: hypothetical protein HC921_09655 [Synechococcaceae cyanobacterium SM2_3_1]|nr:hypothetical protein [Synechococcaceae cyanobacterium SM2_3_1]
MILVIYHQWLERELSGHPLEVLDLCKTANFTTSIRNQNASLQVKASHPWTLRKVLEREIWQVTRVSCSSIKDKLL